MQNQRMKTTLRKSMYFSKSQLAPMGNSIAPNKLGATPNKKVITGLK